MKIRGARSQKVFELFGAWRLEMANLEFRMNKERIWMSAKVDERRWKLESSFRGTTNNYTVYAKGKFWFSFGIAPNFVGLALVITYTLT
jgi:hypothetical protein